nr:cytochrome c oxidase subunit II [Systropus sp. 2 YXA-2022a]
MTTWSELNLQNCNSPMMEQLMKFHDHTMMILAMITILVGYLMMMLFKNKFNNRFLLHGQEIEIIWTIIPAITLMFIALPSLRILYLMDESEEPNLTLKTIGHQWYWSYEYSDFLNLEFDSYMIPTNEMQLNSIRLLDVDNRIILPYNSSIRMIVTSADVIHSWTIPCLGIKIDATPGRLNQMTFTMNRPGIFIGQCSEICGANHSFMPIMIESISTKYFFKWLTLSVK